MSKQVINFGVEIGYATTQLGAKQIAAIECHSFGPYRKSNGKFEHHKRHYIDIVSVNGNIMHRSNCINHSKTLRTVHRAAVRKLQKFLQK